MRTGHHAPPVPNYGDAPPSVQPAVLQPPYGMRQCHFWPDCHRNPCTFWHPPAGSPVVPRAPRGGMCWNGPGCANRYTTCRFQHPPQPVAAAPPVPGPPVPGPPVTPPPVTPPPMVPPPVAPPLVPPPPVAPPVQPPNALPSPPVPPPQENGQRWEWKSAGILPVRTTSSGAVEVLVAWELYARQGGGHGTVVNILGGKKDPGETPPQNARREFSEETGGLASPADIAAILSPNAPTHARALGYRPGKYVLFVTNAQHLPSLQDLSARYAQMPYRPPHAEADRLQWLPWQTLVNSARGRPGPRVQMSIFAASLVSQMPHLEQVVAQVASGGAPNGAVGGVPGIAIGAPVS